MMNEYAALEKAMFDKKLGHKQICCAYRAWIRHREDIPEGIKNILSIAGGGGLLGDLFQIVSLTTGSMELAYRRGEAEGMKQLQAALDAHRWIPVEERLPEKNGRYMIVIANRYVCVSGFALERQPKGFVVGPACKITHWKPIILPEGE